MAKISIAGAGMIGRPGVAAEMFTALAAEQINILMISTSEVKVSCVINQSDCDRAIKTLCKTFTVNSSPVQEGIHLQDSNFEASLPPVRGVALDLKQARLAIRFVPDRPGMAAKIFSLLAEKNISVDTIIQSQRCRVIDGTPTRDMAFTVAQADADDARKVLAPMLSQWPLAEVTVDKAIAKVSIVGAGMVNQPGVAAKMFDALAKHQINIQMIATSEIKISCVVDEDQGVTALQAVHAAFALAGVQKIEVPA